MLGRARTLAPALLAVSLLACGDDAVQPPANDVESVVILADSVHFWVGDSRQLSAEIRNVRGEPLPGNVEWSSTTPAVQVAPTGLVTAVGRGTGFIQARAGDRVAEIPVTSLPVVVGRVHAPVAADFTVLRAVWHTYRMPSNQTSLRTVQSSDPTAHDVAYMQLLREVMRLEHEHDTFLGVLPGLIGERKLIMSRPALPQLGLR